MLDLVNIASNNTSMLRFVVSDICLIAPVYLGIMKYFLLVFLISRRDYSFASSHHLQLFYVTKSEMYKLIMKKI
jgi:hypothetical protein